MHIQNILINKANIEIVKNSNLTRFSLDIDSIKAQIFKFNLPI